MLDPQSAVETIVSLLMLSAWATAFARAARIEDVPPVAWAGLSIMVFAFTWLYLGWGWLMCNVTQVLLFIAVGLAKGLFKEFSHRPKKRRPKKHKSSKNQSEPDA